LRDVRLLSICTFAEIMSRENLRRAPPPSLMGRIATGIDAFNRWSLLGLRRWLEVSPDFVIAVGQDRRLREHRERFFVMVIT
jgi:hypothetical protein